MRHGVRAVKLALLAGLPAGCAAAFVAIVLLHQPPRPAAAGAAIFGLAVGAALAVIVSRRERAEQTALPQLDPAERLLRQGPAECFEEPQGAGESRVGGFLYLTDKRLVFRPHGAEDRGYELSLPLADIVRAEAAEVVWMHPTALHVHTTRRVEQFVVLEEEREAWVAAIMGAKRVLARERPDG